MSWNTLIIAEAGVNHNGDVALARELVAAAAQAGADIVKFQTFHTEQCISTNAPKADYQVENTGVSESQFEMVKKLELSDDAHRLLHADCRRLGIEFLSTAFDIESLDFLMELGIDRIKIPSGEITNLPLLRHIASKGLPIILSTGMATLEEVGTVLEILEAGGIQRTDITILHCNTEYPTPPSDVNLRAMDTMRQTFGTEMGYSDHTVGIDIALAAIARGATIIEKHFTLDRNMEGPDHLASIEPLELAALVSGARNIEQALGGDGLKSPSKSERKNIDIARRSIVAARPIAAGELLSLENLAVKRPGTGISPMRWDELIGTSASRAFLYDELIEL